MRLGFLRCSLVVATLTLGSSASAHFNLLEPAPSSPSLNGGKGAPPCGPDASSDVITAVKGGTAITLRVNETIPHPGFYRVALAIKSRDELDPAKGGLKEPVVKNAAGTVLTPVTGPGTSSSAEYQNPPVFPVLADNLFPHTLGGGAFTGTIMLPNVNCERCTLQVIEFMAQHGPDYFYRHCADLKITADPTKPVFDPDGASGGGGAGGGGAGGAAGGGGAATGGSGGAASAGSPNGGAASAGSPNGGAASAGSPGVGGSASGSPATAGSPSGGNSNGGSSNGGGTPSGGAPGASGSATGGAPGGSGTATSGDGGSVEQDSGGCSVVRPGALGGGAASSTAALLLGLGWLARRRNRAQ